MNFSGTGVSWSLGPRGASVGIGKRGTFLNTGIPGTGFYARERLGGSSASSTSSSTAGKVTYSLTVSINDEGILTFKDEQGNLVPEWQIDAAKKQQGEKIKALIQGKCNELNEQVEALGKIHEYTSVPKPHRFQPQPFDVAMPAEPIPKTPSFFCRWFKSCVAKIDNQNKLALERYKSEFEAWKKNKIDHDDANEVEQLFIDMVNTGDITSVEKYFESVLQDIVWPKETLVSFETLKQGVLAIDVDLLEIEDMPNKTASVPQRGFKLSVKEMGQTQVQKLYMRHAHAVGFRIVGEAFATSPTIETVILSAYSQRSDRATGQIQDQYLYSVIVTRNEWYSINFENLSNLDVVEALTRFELRRDMTKTGVFKPIEPFEATRFV